MSNQRAQSRESNPISPWAGFTAGMALGLTDLGLCELLGVQMRLDQHVVTVPIMLLFGLTFGALGYVIGVLSRARVRERADALTIREQLGALEASQRALVQQEKLAALGRVAAGIAHEVRNPLGVIRASASMLQDGLPEGDDRYRACVFIKEEIDRLNALITALLAFSRPTALHPRPVSLNAVVDRALTLAAPEVNKRRIEVERPGKNDFAPLPADPDLLAQVVLDLLTNAAEALGDAGGRIQVRLADEEGRAQLEVADSGPGVPPPIAEQLFEPFFTTKPQGTGLGLSMAARIAQAHGGTLEVIQGRGAGDGGRGACFRLVLPRHADGAGIGVGIALGVSA